MLNTKTKMFKPLLAVSLLLNLFCMPLVSLADSSRQIEPEVLNIPLSTGVQYSTYHVRDNDFSEPMKILTIDPTDPYTRMETALAAGKLSGNREAPTSMAQRLTAAGKPS